MSTNQSRFDDSEIIDDPSRVSHEFAPGKLGAFTDFLDLVPVDDKSGDRDLRDRSNSLNAS